MCFFYLALHIDRYIIQLYATSISITFLTLIFFKKKSYRKSKVFTQTLIPHEKITFSLNLYKYNI